MKYQIKLYKGDYYAPNKGQPDKEEFNFDGNLSTLAKIIGHNTLKYETPITSELNGWRVFEFLDKNGGIAMTLQFKTIEETNNIKTLEFHPPKIQALVNKGLIKGGKYV